MIRSFRRVLRLLAALALVGAVVVALLEYMNRIDPVAHESYWRDGRALEALDAKLSFEVMRARDGLSANYDGIVETEQAINVSLRRLATPPSHLTTADAGRLKEALGHLTTTMSDKELLIEELKSQNAVLRNSQRYFPVIAEQVRDSLTGVGQLALARLVNDVLTAVLRCGQGDPTEDQLARAQLALDTLSTRTAPLGLGDDMDVVINHGQVVLDRSAAVSNLVNAILAAPTTTDTVAFDVTYQRGHMQALRKSEHRRTLLSVLSIVTVLLVGADIILRLRESARIERMANEMLTRANDALFREKERERELRELKSRFVSMTSHEFRTPLSVILSSSELLEAYGERWPQTKRADHYTRIKAAIRSMTDLLDGVLVIGLAERGKLRHDPAPLDVGRWAAELAEAIRPSLGPNHRLVADVDGDFEDAWADERVLSHVFTNLLANAVKYSPDGGTVRFTVRRAADQAVFTVSDEGIGIPQKDRHELFESFHRGSNVGAISGSGLGLAIVKRALEAAGGDIELDASVSKGTTFLVSMPIAGPATAAPDVGPIEAAVTTPRDGGGAPAGSRDSLAD